MFTNKEISDQILSIHLNQEIQPWPIAEPSHEKRKERKREKNREEEEGESKQNIRD